LSTHAAPRSRFSLRGAGPAALRARPETLFALAIAAVLAAIGLRGGGGLQLSPTTTVEVGLDLGGGVLAALAVLAAVPGRRLYGAIPFAFFALLVVVTGLSILWAIQPSDAWLETNRTLAYLAVFGAGLVLARTAGGWWGALTGGILLAAVLVCGYALLTKVFPSELNADEIYARLREPYGYWNAVGLTAALGVPACLWLGARRHGHAALNALAYPALGVFILTMLLAYSRGSLLAAVLGSALWFVVVPLRLRGVVVLATAAAGAVVVALWVFAQESLTEDRVPIGLQDSAGQELGLALLGMIVLLTASGLAIGFAGARRAPRPETRRAAGVVILVAVALTPVAFLGALAVSDKGLGGSISDGWNSLTDPDASTPPNEPGRLTAVGSVRARYWNESLKIFKAHKLEGVGAGGYATARPRYRRDDLDVRHSHGYLVQTAADLGLIGLVVSLALAAAWLVAALSAGGISFSRDRRRIRVHTAPTTPERVGLLTLLAIVVVFAVHSFVDWTWFVPGTAVPAMLAAGWLAGRGPAQERTGDPAGLMRRVRAGVLDPRRAALAAVVLLVAVAAAWSAWQPLRSVHAGHDALAALDAAPRDPTAVDRARKLAQQAEDRNPLSVEPLFDRAVVETVAGRKDAARVALEDAVRLQPSNPATWLRLADFALHQEANPARALGYLGPALYLDPRSQDGAALYLEATRSGAAPAAPGAAGTTTGPPATAPATTTPTTIPTTPATPTTPGTTTTIGPSTGATP
jgi:hypothetical protein